MNPLWWISIFVYYCGQAYVSFLNNTKGGNWFWVAVIYTALPIWPLISRVSKGLLVDGLIYDVVLFFSYAGTLLLLGAGKTFTLYQWMGFFLVTIGFILLKVKI